MTTKKRVMEEIKETGLKDNEKLMDTDSIPFHLTRGKSICSGLVGKGKIWVHAVYGELKPFMDYLTKKYKTNKVVFTPIINENLLIRTRGFEKKSLPADHPDNPYGETMFYLEGEWE